MKKGGMESGREEKRKGGKKERQTDRIVEMAKQKAKQILTVVYVLG